MSVFIDKHELAEKEDIINPNLAYGVVKTSDDQKALGSVHDFTLNSKDNTDNWTFCKILLKTIIHTGDIFTISAFGTLTSSILTNFMNSLRCIKNILMIRTYLS